MLLSLGGASLEAAVGDKIGTNQRVGDGAHLDVFSEEAKAIVLSNGNVLFYWGDQPLGALDGDVGGVFCKVVAQNGTVVRATFTPYDSGVGHQALPIAAPLAGGGFAIAWENGTTDSVSTSLVDSLVRVFDNSGNPVSAAVRISDSPTTTVNVQHDLNNNNGVIPLPNGNFLAVMRRDERGAAPNHDDDLYQLFSAAGVKIGTNQPVGDGLHLDVFSTMASAIVLTNGNVLFYWVDFAESGLDGDLGGVFCKVVGQDGTVVRGTFTPYDSGTGHQAEPYAAPLVGGGFAIGWESGTTATVATALMDAQVRVFNNSGNPVSSAVRISDAATTTPEVQHDMNNLNGILPLPNGNFFAVMRRDERGTLPNYDDDVYQLFSAAGAKIGTNQPVGDGPHLNVFSEEAYATVLPNGNVLFYWVDQATGGLDGSDGGVFCKVVGQDGTVVRSTFTPYESGIGHQAFPYAAPLAGGGYAIAWEDSSTTTVATSLADAMVRVFNNSGTALAPAVRISDAPTTTPEVQNDLNNLNGILPLPNGNFFAVMRIDERGTLPNYDDDLFQLFEGPPVVVPMPEIGVTEPGVGNVADGGTFSFGTTTVGTSVTRTFTITNTGDANLILSGLTVPAGFSVAQNFGSSTVAPSGGTTTFQITLSAAVAGTPSGMLSFVTNDPDENPYNFTLSGTVNPAPVAVSSLNLVNTTPTNAVTVNWTLTFASAVTGVTASNFSLTGAAATGSTVSTPTTNSGGLTWNVPVTTGSTTGTLRLNLANATGLSPGISSTLPFAGQDYEMDKTAPTVVSVVRFNPVGQTTNTTTVVFRVTYSEPVVLNVPETARFQVVAVGGSTITGTVSSVTGSGATRDVTVNLTGGTGEFRLRVID